MRTPQSVIDEWEAYRPEISLLYHIGHTQAEIKDKLRGHGFKITLKQLEYRLKLWGLRKNLTQREYQFIHRQLSTKPQYDRTSTSVYLNDFPISQEKLQRGLRRYPQQPRYKLILENIGDLDNFSYAEGISFLTPPRSVSPIALDFDDLVPRVDIVEVGSEDPLLAPWSVTSNICWPFLPSIAQFLLTVVKNPSFIRVRESYVLFFLDYLSVLLPLPRRTYEKVGTKCIEKGAEPDQTQNTSLFRAVSKAFHRMNIGEKSHNIYRKFLDSFVVEEFIHTVFSMRGSRGTSKLVALRAILGYKAPKSAPPAIETNALLYSPFYLKAPTADLAIEQRLTSNNMGTKRRRLEIASSPGEAEDTHERPHKISRKDTTTENLGQRLACPFAKGDPSTHRGCLRINRQNLSGIKEHVKRAHFNGTLPPEIRATKTWIGVFRFVFPRWGNRAQPEPYAEINDTFEGIHRVSTEPATVEPLLADHTDLDWSQTQVSQREEYQEPLGELENHSLVPSPRPMSPNLASASLGHGFVTSTSFTNHERILYEASRASMPREDVSNDKRYTLMVARLPYNRNSNEKPGPKRFVFDNFREFGHQFDRWLKSQFTDPPFSWQRYELLNQFTKVHLEDTQTVMDDVDFSFLAQNSTRAALYLVAKDV
ncbi:hypothetical protein TWF481_000302 [Arthrobotrys musiformis]|uniref:Clr5 domain-containing protein n=1 Tax=Arthrobotrys musiformis TaxID=47236 RepID=A0AAV9WMC2_9PEZI